MQFSASKSNKYFDTFAHIRRHFNWCVCRTFFFFSKTTSCGWGRAVLAAASRLISHTICCLVFALSTLLSTDFSQPWLLLLLLPNTAPLPIWTKGAPSFCQGHDHRLSIPTQSWNTNPPLFFLHSAETETQSSKPTLQDKTWQRFVDF